ncbi:MAG: methionyl-tRNA formyltransferase [Blautia sp.]|nr:methionyl-tRNA formyltransferase [Blautia sp.]
MNKIVFMGSPDFAVPALEALLRENDPVIGVVTQPDKPKGRSGSLVPTPVKEVALRHGIPVYQPRKVRDAAFIETLKELAPDLIVVSAFGQIIPKEILDMPRYGCLNIHGSLLPKYRGAAPIQWALIDGEKETGVTIMRMGEGLDTGDMISRKVVPITPEDTGGSLFDKLASAGAELLVETIPSVLDGTAVYEKQPEESPTPYAKMIKKEMGLLQFERSAEELERLVRGLSPWPSAFTKLDGRTFKIWRCQALPDGSGTEAPGTILSADREGIRVACGEGSLLLLEVQLEGKKRMSADAFLRGYPVAPGTKLTS